MNLEFWDLSCLPSRSQREKSLSRAGEEEPGQGLLGDVSGPGTPGLGISAKQTSPRSRDSPSQQPPQRGLLGSGGQWAPRAPLSVCREGIDHWALWRALRPEMPQRAEVQGSPGVKNAPQSQLGRPLQLQKEGRAQRGQATGSRVPCQPS